MRIGQIVTAVLVLAAGLTAAPARAEDPLVARRLTQAGYQFKVDGDGDYVVVFNYAAEKRSQAVFISGKTETAYGIPIRKVFSAASVGSKNPVTGAKALELLNDSNSNKMGSWELQSGTLFLVIKLPDSASAAELQAAMRVAGELADNMEKSISGARDDL